MKLTRLLLPAILPWFFFVANAKENKDLTRANYYYSHYAYFEAIPYFEKVAGSMNDAGIYSELADCYTITNDLQKAADAYSKAVNIAGCNNAVRLKYAQLLMEQGNYDEAAKWLNEYQKNTPPEVRITNLLAGCSKAKERMTAMPEGVASLLSFNTDGSDFAPTLWKGKLVFTSDTAIDVKKKTDHGTGKSYFNIYAVQLKGGNGEFEKLSESKEANIKYNDGPCTFTADGKHMYYTRSRFNDKFLRRKSISNKDSIVLLEIMIASDYDVKEQKFKTIVPFEYNSEEYSVAHPSLSPNGKLLAFSSNMPKGTGGSDIYICRKVGAHWSKPVNAGAINTEGEEVFPYWADDVTLFFSSDGHEGMGGLDIYRSTFDEKTGFLKPENVGAPINSSYDDISLAMRTDGGDTYFSSNRPAAKGGDNLYYYQKKTIFLQLRVVDANTEQPIAGAHVSLDAMKEKRKMETDAKGTIFTQLWPDERYNVNAAKEDYRPAGTALEASPKESDTLLVTLRLTPLPKRQPEAAPPIATETLRPKHLNVMDTPGIRTFEINEIYEVGHFYYEYNSSELTAAHKIFLDTLMAQLKRHPTMRIEIRSHTDCRGGFEFNQLLSKNRALSVVNYLVKQGVPRTRLEYVGLGYSQPAVKCPDCAACTEQEHYLNRILEFRVLQL